MALTGDERYDIIEYLPHDTTNWLLARPERTITRSDVNSNVDLAKTSFTYKDGTNLIETKTFWNKDKEPEETDPVIYYEYNDFGNLISQQDPNLNNRPKLLTIPPTLIRR